MRATWSVLLLLAACSTGDVATRPATPSTRRPSESGATASENVDASKLASEPSSKAKAAAVAKPVLPPRIAYSKPGDAPVLVAQEAWDRAATAYAFNVFVVKNSKLTAAARATAEAAMAALIAASKLPPPAVAVTLTHVGHAATLAWGPNRLELNLMEPGPDGAPTAQRVDFVVNGGAAVAARADLATLPDVDGTYVVAVTSYSLAGVARAWPALTLARANGAWTQR